MPGKQLQMRCFGLPAYSGKRPPPLPRHRTASLARSGIGSLRGNPRLCLFRSDSADSGLVSHPKTPVIRKVSGSGSDKFIVG